jgi:hypothetical protein
LLVPVKEMVPPDAGRDVLLALIVMVTVLAAWVAEITLVENRVTISCAAKAQVIVEVVVLAGIVKIDENVPPLPTVVD